MATGPTGSAAPAAPQQDNTLTNIDISPQNLLNQPAIQQELLRRSQQLSTVNNTGGYAGQLTSFLSQAAALGATFQFRPNVLDQFANYTYHIKWSMTNDRIVSAISSSSMFRNNAAIPKTVIAESGATVGFNIIDFELKNYCSPGPHVRSVQATEFTMTVKEPYGFSLIDRIYSASTLMGITNHLTVPYFIEIWFTGYNEDGTIVTPVFSQALYKLYRVNITKMLTETTSSGTTYRIEGIIDGAFGHSDSVAILAESANIGPVKDIGSFFSQLAVELNSQQSRLDYDNARRIQYAFNVPAWMAKWKFSQNPTTTRRNSDIKSEGSLTEPTISISRGMDVETILYFVISMTKEGQDFIAGENQTGAATTGASIRANGMANVFNIHAKQEIIGFDLSTNDYIRKITYTFTAHPTVRPIIDMANARQTLQGPNQINRAQTIAGSHRFGKLYNYIYTGQNVDVLRFDIKLEWFWQTPIPSQLGENTYSNTAQGPQYDANSVGNELLQRYNRARAQKANASARVAAAQSALARNQNDADAQQALNAAQTDLATANNELRAIGEQNGAQSFQILYNQSAGGQLLSGIQIGQGVNLSNPTVAGTLAQELLWAAATANRRDVYLEDIKIQAFLQRPLPISARTNIEPTDQSANVGGESAKAQGRRTDGANDVPTNRSLVATILNDLTIAPYFAEIELDIRGDPYWMGYGNVDENALIGSTPSNLDVAWFYSGDTGFVLSYRTGQEPDETTGYMKFDNASLAFEGLYVAYEIKNTFRDGKFIQTIKAIRDSLTRPPSQQITASQELAAATAAAASNIANGAAGI
jgi:hypothetical protein